MEKRPRGGWHQVNVYLAQFAFIVTCIVATLLYLAVTYLNAKWPIYVLLFSYTIFLVSSSLPSEKHIDSL